MLPRIAITLCLALLVGSCNKDSSNNQSYTSNKTVVKPAVALVPLIDNTIHYTSWSLSEELTSTIYDRLSSKDNLQLTDSEKIRTTTKKLSQTNDPFGSNISWIKKVFAENEFVVFMELVQHEEIPVNASAGSSLKDSSLALNMTVRVRVVDLRGEPKIILQELVQDTHHILKQFSRYNFYQAAWGQEGYDISPLGLAHSKLTKEIAGRVEDYILMAKQQ
jgi:hypothetical protein